MTLIFKTANQNSEHPLNLTSIEQATCTPITMHKIFIKPDIETLEKSLQLHK